MSNRHATVVVVGGGVTGTAAAYFLARDGVNVALVDQYDLNTQASGRNAGGLHGQIQHEPFLELGESWAREFAPSLHLLHDSIALWGRLEQVLGVSLEVDVCGGIIVAENEAQLAMLERKASIDSAYGGDVELLDQRALRLQAPYLASRMVGGLLCRNEGKANPLLAAPTLARAAESLGAEICLRTKVIDIESRASGFLVSTSRGSIACERIVNCAGFESPEVAAMVGAQLKVEGYPIQMSATEAMPKLVRHLLYYAGGRLTLKQAAVGSLLIGGGWPCRRDEGGERYRVDLPGLSENVRQALEVVPTLAGVRLLRSWVGICPGTPDHRPLLGELIPGFVVAVFPFLGFGCGPMMGKIAAQLTTDGQVPIDLAPFRPDRFHDA